jgi:fatty-acid desaturase
MDLTAFTELPWDIIWKISVTVASIAVVLVVTSRILLDVTRKAASLLFWLLALAGAVYSYHLCRQHNLLNHQTWGPHIDTLTSTLTSHYPKLWNFLSAPVEK